MEFTRISSISIRLTFGWVFLNVYLHISLIGSKCISDSFEVVQNFDVSVNAFCLLIGLCDVKDHKQLIDFIILFIQETLFTFLGILPTARDKVQFYKKKRKNSYILSNFFGNFFWGNDFCSIHAFNRIKRKQTVYSHCTANISSECNFALVFQTQSTQRHNQHQPLQNNTTHVNL